MDEGQGRGIWSEPGLKVGVGAGILFGAVQIYMAHATAGVHYWLYPLQWFGYLVAARIAAEMKYRAQQDDLDALVGVRLAGTGAAMVSSLLVWVMLMTYWLGVDLMPRNSVLFNPVLFFGLVVVDVLLAIGVGTYGGTMIEFKHRNFLD